MKVGCAYQDIPSRLPIQSFQLTFGQAACVGIVQNKWNILIDLTLLESAFRQPLRQAAILQAEKPQSYRILGTQDQKLTRSLAPQKSRSSVRCLHSLNPDVMKSNRIALAPQEYESH